MASKNEPQFLLDRCQAVPALIGDHRDFLIVTGLAGTARDIAALTEDGVNIFTMAGAMGAAAATGLGLALARPDRRVLVVTGDGELLMNIGALATIGVINPSNLSIICVDNGHYGETGYQQSHTGLGVDLTKMASGAGINTLRTIETEEQIAPAARLLRDSNCCGFFCLRVKPNEPPSYKRLMDASAARIRFRNALNDAANQR